MGLDDSQSMSPKSGIPGVTGQPLSHPGDATIQTQLRCRVTSSSGRGRQDLLAALLSPLVELTSAAGLGGGAGSLPAFCSEQQSRDVVSCLLSMECKRDLGHLCRSQEAAPRETTRGGVTTDSPYCLGTSHAHTAHTFSHSSCTALPRQTSHWSAPRRGKEHVYTTKSWVSFQLAVGTGGHTCYQARGC